MPDSIVSCSYYLPRYVLTSEEISRQTEINIYRGQRRVANFDEDIITMAVESADECLLNHDKNDLAYIYLTSTSEVYQVGPTTGLISCALDLPESVNIIELSGSPRSSTSAIISAYEQKKTTLVVSSDVSQNEIKQNSNILFGDASCAFLLSQSENCIARIKDFFTINDTFSPFSIINNRVKFEDARFSSENYYKLLEIALKKIKIPLDSFSYFIFCSWDGRSGRNFALSKGLPKDRVFDSQVDKYGYTGSTSALITLAEVLKIAKPGELVLFTNFWAGVDVIVLESKKTLETKQQQQPTPISYAKFSKFKDFYTTSDEQIFTSQIMLYRERDFLLRRYALKCECNDCGYLLTLPLPVCPKCQCNKFSKVKLSKTGTVFSFTKEYYVPTPDPPVVMAVIDVDGGGRILTQITESKPDEIKIGSRVQLVLRRIHNAGGFPNYYWKARLI